MTLQSGQIWEVSAPIGLYTFPGLASLHKMCRSSTHRQLTDYNILVINTKFIIWGIERHEVQSADVIIMVDSVLTITSEYAINKYCKRLD